MKRNPYLLRCYARPEGDHILGICIDLDLIVKGDSIATVQHELHLAIKSYLESLDKDNLKDLFPRQAPFNIMADYYFVYAIVYFRKTMHQIKDKFDVFCEQATPRNFQVVSCV